MATELVPEATAIADGLTAYVAAAMPELKQRDALDLVWASCDANTRALLHALSHGHTLAEMGPSDEVIGSTRAMVQQGLSHDAVTRGYRVGLSYWCERWAQAVERRNLEMSLAVRVAREGTTFLLGWLDLITERISAEYRDEAERLAREGSLARAAYVRGILGDDEFDVSTTDMRLGYDLTGDHRALVLARHPDATDSPPLDSTARALAGALTSTGPLVVRVDVDTIWCWISTRDSRPVPAAQAPVLAGLGRPSTGLDGFRRSHRQACEALRVARLAGSGAGTVVDFGQVEVTALCSSDPAQCRTFVADALGRLAADTDDARRLRETLHVFFECNSNFRAAAARLNVHHNTVRYRLDQAEALLGHPPGEDRLRLELALHLSAHLGSGLSD
ncbi:helix-turn-helix domain-containing protein [Rhodococcus pyridinivorans]|uniref:PucR family transcriptional regulator n=1 Tax=Rhodococcus pyridinivorans TaxID=103816 RepID=UPI001E302C9A|nr:helix-turn-helix domain-containing protein [Rhodococcus pyridinivorans]MCD5422498.1 helix-turn-helix domain-containing protein [Rhodococcus pyridinivorans]